MIEYEQVVGKQLEEKDGNNLPAMVVLRFEYCAAASNFTLF